MTTVRDCYMKITRFEPPERIPNFENKISPRMYEIWQDNGDALDLDFGDDDGYWSYFGLDPKPAVYRGVNYGPIPALEPIEAMMLYLNELATDPGLAEKLPKPKGDGFWLNVDDWGRMRFLVKRSGANDKWANSAYHDIRGALMDRRDWDMIKDRFQPDAGRWGEKWDEYAEANKAHENVLVLEVPAIGALKWRMAYENFCLKLYDDPELIHEIISTQVDLAISMLDEALNRIDFDMIWFWEDIAYRHGQLFAPSAFERVALEPYQRLIEHYKDLGGSVVAIDSDGDIRRLIPSWLKCGVNHIWPLEPFADMDVVALRKEYGQAFTMRGGVDKFALEHGKEGVDRELDRIFPVVQDGGYIPHLDHMMPETVTFETYCYYLEKKREMLASC